MDHTLSTVFCCGTEQYIYIEVFWEGNKIILGFEIHKQIIELVVIFNPPFKNRLNTD